MSKRKGDIVTVDDLMDAIGVDAARFFMVSRSHDSTLDLDLDLAVEQSSKNPVYYVQYAHARICSILRNPVEGERPATAKPSPAVDARTRTSAPCCAPWRASRVVREAADGRAPHRVPATWASWRPSSTSSTGTAACWSTTSDGPRSARACAWRRGRSSPRAWGCSGSRRPDSDVTARRRARLLTAPPRSRDRSRRGAASVAHLGVLLELFGLLGREVVSQAQQVRDGEVRLAAHQLVDHAVEDLCDDLAPGIAGV